MADRGHPHRQCASLRRVCLETRAEVPKVLAPSSDREPRTSAVARHESGCPPPLGENQEDLVTTINDLCQKLVSDVPDAVAANVVDLSSGMMLGGHFNSNFTTDHFEAVSAAATALYRGKETLRVEDLVKSQRGISDASEHFVEEVQMTTRNFYHFIKKLPGKEAIVCLVTKTSCSLGMGWSSLKATMDRFAPLVPS
jgi:hypothetical protein